MANEKRLIDANAYIAELCKDCGGGCDGEESCILVDGLRNAPTVDAVEVVRCKDCRYCQHDAYGLWCFNDYEHSLQPDDFCSHGERKDNV